MNIAGNKFSIRNVLDDSRLLANRMRKRDENFDNFLKRGYAIKNLLTEKKKIQEGSVSLRELSEKIPPQRSLGAYVLCVAAENEQLEKLREENRILRLELEEHKEAIELIMAKYRSQMTQCLYLKRREAKLCSQDNAAATTTLATNQQLPSSTVDEPSNLVCLSKQDLVELVLRLNQRIHKLTQLSRDSIHSATTMSSQMQGHIHQLELENTNLRQLMDIHSSIGGRTSPLPSIPLSSHHPSRTAAAVEEDNDSQQPITGRQHNVYGWSKPATIGGSLSSSSSAGEVEEEQRSGSSFMNGAAATNFSPGNQQRSSRNYPRKMFSRQVEEDSSSSPMLLPPSSSTSSASPMELEVVEERNADIRQLDVQSAPASTAAAPSFSNHHRYHVGEEANQQGRFQLVSTDPLSLRVANLKEALRDGQLRAGVEFG